MPHDSQSPESSGSAAPAHARRAAVHATMRSRGQTIASWADEHGYSRRTVYHVLSGRLQGHFGISHNIAVRLGLKAGEVDPAAEPAALAQDQGGRV
ncbi:MULTISPECIES: DNA-binding protein [Sphingomonas]|uniref:DNA-binding protein n=1 Tax=Sphingomonas molluscorum TaxID=418184 RepID=A0ABU8Q7L7_9SPHN|nr:DNA-binding protein [Sphingomonas sp. JUb134]MBM7407083.1 gp16 family phage-associated protein [Sphingomonas sp. JUb134]